MNAIDSAALLEIDHLTAGYGDVTVLRGIDLVVRRGEICAILGPNGAGKSTLLNSLVGLAEVTGGDARLDGKTLRGGQLELAAKRGISYVPQGRWLFQYATGMENIWSGGYSRGDTAAVESEAVRFTRDWPIAGRVAKRRAAGMSGGEQQVVALGRGLLARPRLLLVDEPSMGLAPVVIGDVYRLLKKTSEGLSGEGAAVILAEQNVELALRLADRICVLNAGEVVLNEPRAALTAAAIADLYL